MKRQNSDRHRAIIFISSISAYRSSTPRAEYCMSKAALSHAARIFALSHVQIEEHRLGLLGFTMGGRLAMALAANDPAYSAMALWAPSAINGAASMQRYLGGGHQTIGPVGALGAGVHGSKHQRRLVGPQVRLDDDHAVVRLAHADPAPLRLFIG